MSILRLQLSAQRAKRVATLLGNETARRIMDAISSDSKSESEIAKELNLPLSTVHYNVKRLTEEGLIKSEEYTYSEKGREMRQYALASEHVIITTKPLATAPSVISGLLFAAATASVVAYLNRPAPMAMTASSDMMMAAAPMVAAQPTVWPFIIIGAISVLVGILIVQLIWRLRP